MDLKKLLFLDIETYSKIDLLKVGSYLYGQDDSTRILTCCYISTTGKEYIGVFDESVVKYLEDSIAEGYTLVCHNAVFEYDILCKYIKGLELSNFFCTSWLSRLKGGPSSLHRCAAFWKLKESKMTVGVGLIKSYIAFFDKGGLFEDFIKADKFKTLLAYNKKDTEVTKELLYKIMETRPLTAYDMEEYQYWLDTNYINRTGIPFDVNKCADMLEACNLFETKISDYFLQQYNFNPRSPKQLNSWLNAHKAVVTKKTKCKKTGEYVATVTTEKVSVNAVWHTFTDTVKNMFELKYKYPSVMVKKLDAVKKLASPDNRIRGLLYHHETITGRLASRNLNILNFPRSDKSVALWKKGQSYKINEGFALSNSLRSLIKPKAGHSLVVSDLSQIEFRILMHFSGHKEVLAKLEAGQDLYMQLADDIFGTNPDRKKESMERNIAKAGTLSIGYGAGPYAFFKILSKDIKSVDISLAKKVVRLYAQRYPKVKELSNHINLFLNRGVSFKGNSFTLENDYMLLPSGRKFYIRDINKKQNLYAYKSTNYSYDVPAHTGLAWLCQGTARDIIHSVQSKCVAKAQELGTFKVLFNEYDKVILETTDEYADQLATNLKLLMLSSIDYFKLGADTEVLKWYK